MLYSTADLRGEDVLVRAERKSFDLTKLWILKLLAQNTRNTGGVHHRLRRSYLSIQHAAGQFPVDSPDNHAFSPKSNNSSCLPIHAHPFPAKLSFYKLE